MAHYTVYQSQDGLWRASFAPRIAKCLGKAADYILAPSENTATIIADSLAKDALQQIRSVREKIIRRVKQKR